LFLVLTVITNGFLAMKCQHCQSAGWQTDPAFSRNRKPPALAGGRSRNWHRNFDARPGTALIVEKGT
jgi:hypothetical protein